MRQNKNGEPRLFRTFGRFSSLLLISAIALNAGAFEDFKRTQNESFKKYKDEKDTEFNNYLKQQWKEYKEFVGQSAYEEPKPKTIPKTTFVEPKSLGPKIIIKIKPPVEVPKAPVVVQPKQEVAEQPKEVQKPEVVQQPKVEEKKAPVVVVKKVEVPKKDINFVFYGSMVGFDIPKNMRTATFSPMEQEGIANFFDVVASSDYKDLVNEIKTVQQELNLNDWGVYLLVNEISSKVFDNQDDRTLLSWFVFNKLGYSVRVGIANKHVVMLHYSKKVIYSTPSYTLSDKKYYALSFYNKSGVGRLFTYNKDYPDSTKAFDLSIKVLPNFVDDSNAKNLKFKYEGKEYAVNFDYNKNIIDFMASYPQADYDTYFDAPIENKTYEQIAIELKKYLDGKRASDAMNFVLSFVQHAFLYQTDPQQFGREKPMFAEETLYYDKSDCEDRAVLYAYLMKKLFNVNIVGIKYKDHMATAVQIPLGGDAVTVDNKRFVIADPTYINATIGQSMPQYKSVIPDTFITVKVD